MASFGFVGMIVAVGLAGCAGDAQPGPSPSTGGATGQASGGTGTGGAAAGGAAAGGASTGGASTGGGTSDSSPDASVGGTGASPSGGTSGASSSGGGSGPAGAGGAGGVQASTGGGTAAGTGCTGYLFCDDFESYTVGNAPNGKWTTQARGSAKAVIDTTMSFSGTKSVHFTGTVDQSSANILAQSAPTFPLQGKTLFVRMMMYIKSYPATSGTHSRFMRIGTNTNGADGTAYAVDTYNGTGIEHVNSGMYRDTSLHLSDTTLQSKWICWEFELDNSAGPPAGDTGTVMAYLWHDGIAASLKTTSDKLPWNPITWQMLEIGLEAYQTDAVPGDFWVDDVAASNSKIDCPTK